MRILDVFSLAVILTATAAAPALAQQTSTVPGRTASSVAIDAALAGHESETDGQRATLAEFLSRDDVKDVAREHGIDMGRVGAAATGLSDAQVGTVAPMVAAAMPQDGRGGLGSVTISVVAIIVILLIIILVT